MRSITLLGILVTDRGLIHKQKKNIYMIVRQHFLICISRIFLSLTLCVQYFAWLLDSSINYDYFLQMIKFCFRLNILNPEIRFEVNFRELYTILTGFSLKYTTIYNGFQKISWKIYIFSILSRYFHTIVLEI